MFPFLLLACGESERRVAVPHEQPDSGEQSDGSETGKADICLVNEEFVAQRKACNSDADCSLLTYLAACCAEQRVAGINSDGLQAAQACMKLACTCEPGLHRTEDGRSVVERNGQAVVQCIEGSCSSRVTQRQCGTKRVCNAKEICVTHENVPGGFPPDPDSGDNAYLTFRCEPNPCSDRLDCACAQPLCDARNDVARTCEIENNEESDLTCRPFVD